MRDWKKKKDNERRIRQMMSNKINWFSCTISPAPKNEGRGEIESLEEAIKYYAPYTDRVIIQPKWMGSYTLIHLCRNLEKTKFFSRNGYLITDRLIPRQDLLDACSDLHREYLDNPSVESVWLEVEMMPWRALGDRLIDREFGSYYEVHKGHINFMERYGLSERVSALQSSQRYQNWKGGDERSHIKRQYSSVDLLERINKEKIDRDGLALFKEQLDLWGTPGKTHFKVFNELKIRFLNGEENLCQYNDSDRLFSTEEGGVEWAYRYLNSLPQKEMEGVVVKPAEQNLVGVCPALKVRFPHYLQLIYGANFTKKFDYYFQKRRVTGKMRESISDYEIARQLLRLPFSSLNSHNKQYKHLLEQAISAEDRKSKLDWRL